MCHYSKRTYYPKSSMKYLQNPSEKNHVHEFLTSLTTKRNSYSSSTEVPFITQPKSNLLSKILQIQEREDTKEENHSETW